jgi:hypothetical protein
MTDENFVPNPEKSDKSFLKSKRYVFLDKMN